MSYTKGPWKYSKSTGRVTGPAGNTVADARYKNSELDAPLISASPDLLEALKEVEWSDGGYCPQCERRNGEQHQDKCLVGNAIAKAKGWSA